jgi:cysteine synthase A
MAASRELARKEGVFVGTTSGATLAGALQIAKRAPQGSTVLCMLPDTGERYLTTPLFEGVREDMNDDELEISRSTPTARFDAPAPTPAPAAAAPAQSNAPDSEAIAFVDQTIADQSQPVVLFALEWCEFCWSVRKLFTALGVSYRSIDLDAAANQANDWGGRVRRAVNVKAGALTIPQIFVGGTLIGGATETFDAYRSGKLQKLLQDAGVTFDANAKLDPYGFLPKWLQPRASA